MKATYKIHKSIKDKHGNVHSMCSKGRKNSAMSHLWKKVTCPACLEIKEIGLSSKQIREVARRRMEGEYV